MTGMPLDPTASLAGLASDLSARALLDPASAATLLGRLGVSLRGLDAQRARPDAVVLLCDDASASVELLAATLARRIFGRETARIDIDLAGMTDDSSISTLLGSAPGLIGSDRPLPLHELRRSPWQVVTFRGIDLTAASIRETIATALHSGSFTDAMGRRIPLGAAIVLLTAPSVGAVGDGPVDALLAARLGPSLLGACDVVTGMAAGAALDARTGWIRSDLLAPLAERLTRAGYPPTFAPEVAAWLDRRLPTDGSAPETFIDRSVAPAIVAALPTQPGPITVGITDDHPTVTPRSPADPRPKAKSGTRRA